jgi:raffinose/stachyose/melibiose transport system permease protein
VSQIMLLEEERRPGRPPGVRGGARRRPVRSVGRGLSALALPAFVLYGVFVLVALLLAIVLSFTNWPVGGSISFAGLANWRAFFATEGPHTLAVTGEVIGLSLVVQIPLSVALGIFAAGRQRYRAVLSWIYVLPLLVSPTGIAITWARLFDPTFGGLSPVLTQTWLSSSVTAPILVTMIFSWRIVPFYMILVQAAVRTIPRELSEAAVLDGASRAAEIWHIVLPQLRHTIVVVSILCVTGALTAFDLFYVMTGGGPDEATTTLAVGVYLKAFTDQALGAASVYAVVVAALGVLFAGTVSRLTGFGAMRSERQ